MTDSAEPSRRLGAWWSKRERDIMIDYPRSPDGHLLHGFLSHRREVDADKFAAAIGEGMSPRLALHIDGVQGPSITEELERRGYDIKTLRFRIDLDAAYHYIDGR